jgi:integral membrane protein
MSALHQLRVVAMLEGLSLALLVFVAMPLKHMAGMPLAVRIVGGLHGMLFLLFCVMLYRVVLERRWPARRSLLAFVWSLVPLGFIVLDRNLRTAPPQELLVAKARLTVTAGQVAYDATAAAAPKVTPTAPH